MYTYIYTKKPHLHPAGAVLRSGPGAEDGFCLPTSDRGHASLPWPIICMFREISICTHMNIYMYVCVCIYIHIYTCINIYIYICRHIYTCTQINVYIHMYIYIYV